jgi:hypothetical protein
MALTQVTGPYPIFTDLDGTPLDDGYLYIGEINEDPEQNPIQVYFDANLTIPATQPIRTSNGYAYRNGTPALLYTAGEFSITIRNKRQEFVLYSPVGYGFDPAAVSASVVKNDFVGDGVTINFTLSSAPSTNLATNAFINGVYQEKDSYSVFGNVISFSIAPPLNSSIEVMTNETGVINTGNATAISYTASLPGATTQTVQTKLEQYVSVKDFGAVGDGVADDSAAIQAAIDAVNTGGGGQIWFPQGKYNIETTGLVIYQNIILSGDVTRYGGSTTRGTSIIYTGTGSAIYGENILDAQILDLDIDCTGSTGTYPNSFGIYLNGCWKSTLRNVTVRGLTLAKGYAIAIDTNPDAFGPPSPANAWGAQHNYLEQIEVPDGTILFVGTGASDGVTTTVCNTIRGYQYEIASSQIVFINSTAEGWSTGIGFNFYGVGCYGLMLGCDIEGAGSPGIQIDGNAEVREMGTIWAGFSGAVKVNGYMASMRSYGGAFEWNADLTVGVPAKLSLAGNKNVSDFVSEYLYPVSITGGAQDGYRLWKRRNAGVDITDHNWQQHAYIQKAISTSSTSAVTLFTIPVPNGSGLRLSAHAAGTQAGNTSYSNSRNCNVMNAGGTLTIVQDTQVTAGDSGAISFVASGSSVLVRWTPTTVNASTGSMTLEIRGPWTSYS